MPEDPDPNEDLKAKMREALDRKKAHGGINPAGPGQGEGPRVGGRRRAGPKMHRRKAGGGGS